MTSPDSIIAQCLQTVREEETAEYLSALNTRNKWVEEKRNIAPVDVVLLVDPGNPPGHWPLGRIQEVFPGPEGKVRVVRVRMGGKDHVRPITKLCSLEI